MKDIFKKVANALDNMLFTIPRLQLNTEQKNYLESNGYKATRSQMPLVISPYAIGAPMIPYDHISRKDGADLTNQEYKELAKTIETIGQKPEDQTPDAPQHKL
jgi:hypothetical protein